MSPSRVIYSKPCHFSVEIKHRAWWTIKMLNYDMTKAGEEKRLQLTGFKGIGAEAYESDRSYKEGGKLFHGRHILNKKFAWE